LAQPLNDRHLTLAWLPESLALFAFVLTIAILDGTADRTLFAAEMHLWQDCAKIRIKKTRTANPSTRYSEPQSSCKHCRRSESLEVGAAHGRAAWLRGFSPRARRPRTPCLSEDWWEAISAGREETKRVGLSFDFMDEYDWPSGEILNV
jgi:hypothetical protein